MLTPKSKLFYSLQKLKGGSGGVNGSVDSVGGARMSSARRVHHEVCSVLLGSLESLQHKMSELGKLLPEAERPKINVSDCVNRLANLSDMAKVS